MANDDLLRSALDADARFRGDYRAEIEAKTDGQLVAHLHELHGRVDELGDVVKALADELSTSLSIALERLAPDAAADADALLGEHAGD